jgi:hypothetical protein
MHDEGEIGLNLKGREFSANTKIVVNSAIGATIGMARSSLTHSLNQV